MAMNSGTQHQSLLEHIVLRKDFLERRVEMLNADFCEEAEPAHVDSQNRDVAFLDEPRCIQHGAVAAQHEDHIRERRELGDLVIRTFADEGRSFSVKHHLFLTLSQPSH